MNLNDDIRAFRRAQNAEAQRKRRSNCGRLDEEYNRCNIRRQSRRNAPGVREHEAAQRLAARDVPGVREHEAAQKAVARTK